MNLEIEKADFDEIASFIHSDTSPVGIDAKKTHVIIIEKLVAIEERLSRIESQLKSQ